MSTEYKKKIFVIEDDTTILQALVRRLTNAGYLVFQATDGQRAKGILRFENMDLIIIDCMLPETNGVDLAQELRTNLKDTIIYLTSGIFTSKEFVKTAKQKASAKRFLTKPLDLNKLLSDIKEDLSLKNDNALGFEPLTNLLDSNSDTLSLDKIKKRDEFLSLEVPFIILELLDLGWKGQIVLNDNFFINLQDKFNICIDQKNNSRVYKKILLEKLYVKQSDLNNLKQDSDESLIDQLINAYLISPHCAIEIKNEVTKLYLKEILSIQSSLVIELKENSDSVETNLNINIHNILNDLSLKTIPLEDLKNFYSKVKNREIVVLKQNLKSLDCFFKQLDPLKKYSWNEMQKTISRKTIVELLENISEEALYRSVYLLSSNRAIRFLKQNEKEYETAFEERNLKLYRRIKGKEPFEILTLLGASSRMTKKEIKNILNEIVKRYHSDVLQDSFPKELKRLNDRVFAIVSSACNFFLAENSRKEHFNKGKEEAMIHELESEDLFKKGFSFVNQRLYKKAYETFKHAYSLFESENILLHLVWMELKTQADEVGKNRVFWLEKKRIQLSTMSVEIKRQPSYQVTMAVLFKLQGDIRSCFQAINKALSLDPNFLEAKRDLFSLREEKKQASLKQKSSIDSSKSILTQDISSVIKNFLKKKAN